MVWLGGIARSWANALILNIENIGRAQVFLWGIAPDFFSDASMELLSERLSETISKSLNHDHVIVILVGFEASAGLFLAETC